MPVGIITRLLIIINSVAFVPWVLDRLMNSSWYDQLVDFGVKRNSAIANGEWYRLLTSNYLHGSPLHLLMNMYALNSVGTLVEGVFGWVNMLVIYTLSGIGGSVLSYVNVPNNSLGASGAIMGLIGASLSFALIAGETRFASILIQNVVIIGVIGFFLPNIDNWGHFGGFAVGLVLGAIFYLTR